LVVRALAVSFALSSFVPRSAPAAEAMWIPIDPGPRRMGHTLTADPARNRALLFGGWDGTGFLDPSAYHSDVWQLDLSTFPAWTPLTPGGGSPAGRIEHVAVLDPVRDRLIVFAGKTGTAYFNDLWSLDLTTLEWSPLEALGTPPPPLETRGVYDPVRDRIVFFGGYRPENLDLDSLWALSLAGTPAWTPLVAAGPAPPVRSAHAMIYDPEGDRVVVLGGIRHPSSYRNDVWSLSLAGLPTWTQILSDAPLPPRRYGHNVVYVPNSRRMVVFGGFNGVYMNDLWSLDLDGPPVWRQYTTPGAIPAVRDFSAMAWDDVQDRIVMAGGNASAGVKEDAWLLQLGEDPVSVLVSAAAADVSRDRVRLRWNVSETDRSYEVQRREGAGDWLALDSIVPDGSGWLAFEDATVRPGGSYAYRLAYLDEAALVFGGEISVDVPFTDALALAVPPIVNGTRFTAELTLPSRGAARLEVFDVAGRRAHEQDTGALDAGRHVVDLGSTARWDPGVYWVRLSLAGSSVQRRVVVLR